MQCFYKVYIMICYFCSHVYDNSPRDMLMIRSNINTFDLEMNGP